MPFITRNSKTLESFVRYCENNPEQRFWQALRNWALMGTLYNFIYLSAYPPYSTTMELTDCMDTFSFEGRFKNEQ